MGLKASGETSAPQHVCIIMDGNGRWAKKRLMPRTLGHRKGVEITRKAVEFFVRSGVKHLTLFAFSSENWNRPKEEVSTLMDLFMHSLEKYSVELNEKGVRIRFIGDRDAFSEDLQGQIAATELLTADNDLLSLNIAANYGGQWDILNAVKTIADKLQRNEINPGQIDAALFESALSLNATPDPDLFIRTGGEQRISNFLLWQIAYAELYFTDILWPDFNEDEMQKALDVYSQRQRRYGKTGDQVGI